MITEAVGQDKIALRGLTQATGGKWLDTQEKFELYLAETSQEEEAFQFRVQRKQEDEGEVVERRVREGERERGHVSEAPERAIQRQRQETKKERRQ